MKLACKQSLGHPNTGPNRNADIMGQFAHLAAGEDLSAGDKMEAYNQSAGRLIVKGTTSRCPTLYSHLLLAVSIVACLHQGITR
jgi:hypothetical protein